MQNLFNKIQLKFKKFFTSNVENTNILTDSFFDDLNYPVLFNINIFIIYTIGIEKFYGIDIKVFDLVSYQYYNHPYIDKVLKHIKNRMYNDNYGYIYHIQNLTRVTNSDFYDIGIDNIFSKVLNVSFNNEKDFKQYLETILHGPSETFINIIDDINS